MLDRRLSLTVDVSGCGNLSIQGAEMLKEIAMDAVARKIFLAFVGLEADTNQVLVDYLSTAGIPRFATMEAAMERMVNDIAA
jgi:hypothetical protein